jgi:hypothetical protein
VAAGAAPGDALVVEAVGTTLRAHLRSQPDRWVEATDHHYAEGSVGLRVVDTHAVFTRLDVEPVP